MLTTGGASFGCEEISTPAGSDPPHGHLNASGTVAFFFWQQLALAGDAIWTFGLQQPHAQVLPLCPQQHGLESPRAAALAVVAGTTGHPMLPTTNATNVTRAVRRRRRIGNVFVRRRMPE